tara:strand:+ start:86 stop:304 length:219 start_codon:yes stop_codon:yes gene_type:complete
MPNPVSNIFFSACEVIVQANHFFASLHQAISQVGAEESGAACDQIASAGQGKPGAGELKVSGMAYRMVFSVV